MPFSEGTSRGLQYDQILEPLSGVFLIPTLGLFLMNLTDQYLAHGLDLFEWSATGALLGLAITMAYLLILRLYIKKRTTESVSVSQIMDRVLGRVAVTHRFSTAIIDVERVTITAFLAPGRRTLVITKPAAMNLLRVPDKAEPLLAAKVVELDRGSLPLRVAGYVLLFFACWALASGNWGPGNLWGYAQQNSAALVLMVAFGVGLFVLILASMSLSVKPDTNAKRVVEELYKVDLKEVGVAVFGEAIRESAPQGEGTEAIVRAAWSEGRYRYAIPILALVIGSTLNLVLTLPVVSFMLTAPFPLHFEMYLIFLVMAAAMYLLPLLLLWLLKHVLEPNYLVGGVTDLTCSHVERTFHEVLGRENPIVPVVRKNPREGDIYLVSENISRNRERILHVVPRAVLDCLQEDELTGSYIVSLFLLERAYLRQMRRIGGLTAVTMAVAMILPLVLIPHIFFDAGLMAVFVLMFLLLTMYSLATYIVSRQRKQTERTTDVDLARRYARHPEAVRRLVDCGIVPETGRLSFAKRLKYLRDAGFLDKESRALY